MAHAVFGARFIHDADDESTIPLLSREHLIWINSGVVRLRPQGATGLPRARAGARTLRTSPDLLVVRGCVRL